MNIMKVGAKMRRQSDGKEFTVRELGHWSYIVSPDDIEDLVKFSGGDYEYVSVNSGEAFTLKVKP